jgi:hypothetical protein
MRSAARNVLTAAVLACIAVLPGSARGADSPPERLSFNRYYDYDQAVQAMRSLVARFPRLASLRSIGKSIEGRDMWLVTLDEPGTGPRSERPRCTSTPTSTGTRCRERRSASTRSRTCSRTASELDECASWSTSASSTCCRW